MEPETTQAFDPDGRAVVGVRLSNAPDKTAYLYREDFDRITAAYPGKWSLVDARKAVSYVRVRRDGRSIYVARLVANASAGESVVIDDGNPLDLRSNNIGITNGPGGRPRYKPPKSWLHVFRITPKAGTPHA